MLALMMRNSFEMFYARWESKRFDTAKTQSGHGGDPRIIPSSNGFRTFQDHPTTGSGFGDTMMMTPTSNVENGRDEAYLAHSYYSGCQCMDRKQASKSQPRFLPAPTR